MQALSFRVDGSSDGHPDPGLGVRYRSVTDEPYSTITGDDWSHVAEDWTPVSRELWTEVEPHWSYEHDRPRSE